MARRPAHMAARAATQTTRQTGRVTGVRLVQAHPGGQAQLHFLEDGASHRTVPEGVRALHGRPHEAAALGCSRVLRWQGPAARAGAAVTDVVQTAVIILQRYIYAGEPRSSGDAEYTRNARTHPPCATQATRTTS
jgi:hypothetical protein